MVPILQLTFLKIRSKHRKLKTKNYCTVYALLEGNFCYIFTKIEVTFNEKSMKFLISEFWMVFGGGVGGRGAKAVDPFRRKYCRSTKKNTPPVLALRNIFPCKRRIGMPNRIEWMM
jgi:hypothetical protein